MSTVTSVDGNGDKPDDQINTIFKTYTMTISDPIAIYISPIIIPSSSSDSMQLSNTTGWGNWNGYGGSDTYIADYNSGLGSWSSGGSSVTSRRGRLYSLLLINKEKYNSDSEWSYYINEKVLRHANMISSTNVEKLEEIPNDDFVLVYKTPGNYCELYACIQKETGKLVIKGIGKKLYEIGGPYAGSSDTETMNIYPDNIKIEYY